MNKQELRTLFLAKRLLLTEDEVILKSNSLSEKALLIIREVKPSLVLLFLPISNKNEFDCKELVVKLWSLGIKTAIPVTDFTTKAMHFAIFDSNTELVEKKYGISEPRNPIYIKEYKNALAIVPLLAHDKSNFRVGYGGGFYDRFFQQQTNMYKLGVTFFAPVDFIDDLDTFDIRLDKVVFD